MNAIHTELQQLLAGLTPSDREAAKTIAADELASPWRPSAGPQTAAYLSKADVVLYGGAAGGGKTDLLCGTAVRDHKRSLILRRQGVELDGIEARLSEMLAGSGRWNGTRREWSLAQRRSIKLGGCNALDDWRAYAGRPRDFLGLDEAGEFAEVQPASLLAWLRSTDPGQRCRMVLASNPPRGGEGIWLLTWFAPWLDPLFPDPAPPGDVRFAVRAGGDHIWVDGPDPVKEHPQSGETLGPEPLIPMGYTFVPARLDDNPFLAPDTGYRARLMALPEPLRSQLLHGDFLAGREDDEWQVVPSIWVSLAQERWRNAENSRRRPMLCIGVDIAQGGKDETVLAPLYGGNLFGALVARPGAATPDGPSVAQFVVQHRRDAALPVIDLTGGWGISARDHLEAQQRIPCEEVVFSARSGARTGAGDFAYQNLRAELWWSFREALDPESGEAIALPPDGRLLAELTAPRWLLRGDAIQIESKDDLRARLGTSTDRADAVVMAWHARDMAVANKLKGVRPRYAAPTGDPLAEVQDLHGTHAVGAGSHDGTVVQNDPSPVPDDRPHEDRVDSAAIDRDPLEP